MKLKVIFSKAQTPMSDKRWTKWSQWEERSLRELYDPFWTTRATIAERIGRSPRAGKDKIRREGLKKLQYQRHFSSWRRIA